MKSKLFNIACVILSVGALFTLVSLFLNSPAGVLVACSIVFISTLICLFIDASKHTREMSAIYKVFHALMITMALPFGFTMTIVGIWFTQFIFWGHTSPIPSADLGFVITTLLFLPTFILFGTLTLLSRSRKSLNPA